MKIVVIERPYAAAPYLVTLQNEGGKIERQKAYKTGLGAVKAIHRLQDEGHTADAREFDKIQMA